MTAEKIFLRTPNAQLVQHDLSHFADYILPRINSMGICSDDSALLAATILTCRESNKRLVIFRANFPADFVQEQAAALKLEALVSGSWLNTHVQRLAPSPTIEPCLGVYTSGTSGPPKLALHNWHIIGQSAQRVPQRLHGKNWLASYSATSYAGLQVLFSAYDAGGALIVPPKEIAEHPQTIVQEKVDVISATPTYWRLLLNVWPKTLACPILQQATLGGETVDQSTINRIAAHFKPVGLSHIYASTEMGTAIVVSDKREGFPAQLLERQAPAQLRINDGFLEVRGSQHMMGYAQSGTQVSDDWYRTPDKVEQRGDRVYFLGRDDSIINVGGAKINPEPIEAALRAIEGVTDARVYGRKNPLVGALLCADVVLAAGFEISEQQLKNALREHITEAQMPRLIRAVTQFDTLESGKKARNANS